MGTERSNEIAQAPERGIRSWVRREGRLTQGQSRALTRDAGSRLIEAPATGPLAIESSFGRHGPLYLEIGCGNGEFITRMAARHPDNCYLGLEVHRPGLGYALQKAEQAGLANLRLMGLDAAESLDRLLPEGCLSGCYIFFPDPWPKKRHHKRRIIQAPFLELLQRKLARHGRIWLATDWGPYFEWMVETFESSGAWRNLAGPGRAAPRPAWRPLTRFEQRGLRLGHEVRDLVYAPLARV